MRCDQRRTESDRRNSPGWRMMPSRKRSHRGDATAAVHHHRQQQAHGVRAPAVAHRLDVGVFVGVDRRGDGDAVGEVGRRVVGLGADDGLAVGAGDGAEPGRQVRQAGLVPEPVQELLGAECGGREHDLVGPERAGAAPQPGARATGPHLVAAAVEGVHVDHLVFGVDGAALALGQVQVVDVERVLGAVPAPGHAAPAADAADPIGPGAAEEGIGCRHARAVTEEHAHRGGVIGVGHTELVGEVDHDAVGPGLDGGLDHPEHALGLVVERRQLGPPVGDVGPGRVLVEGVERSVERVGVDDRTTAHRRPREHGEVAQERDALDAPHPQPGKPEEVAHVPTGLGQRLGGVAPPGLDDADPVALLGQAQRGDTAAETTADHEDVVGLHGRTVRPVSGRDQRLDRGRDTRGSATETAPVVPVFGS